eukprot:jgi/Mesen1/9354/ME000061S08789
MHFLMTGEGADAETGTKRKRMDDGHQGKCRAHEGGVEGIGVVVRKEAQPGKKQKANFIYGNYNRYYGYRVGAALDSDPRLKHFQREWFEGKECLDVGCNEGFVTISVGT